MCVGLMKQKLHHDGDKRRCNGKKCQSHGRVKTSAGFVTHFFLDVLGNECSCCRGLLCRCSLTLQLRRKFLIGRVAKELECFGVLVVHHCKCFF
jgi:hypothetical protein